MSAVIHWFRRDLRVEDNTALAAASRDGSRVIPVFLLDDHYAEDPGIGPARFGFLRESLETLSARLAARGGRLVLRPGPAARALPEMLRETGASAVYANSEIGPYPQARDAEVSAAVAGAGARLRLFADELLVEPSELVRAGSAPLRVFTPFWKRWKEAEKRDPVAAPAHLETPPLRSVPIEEVASWRDLAPQPLRPRGGEEEARRALDRFVGDRLERYASDRDDPAREGTSLLSPHLHFGTISARTIRARVLGMAGDRAPGESVRRFLAELAWREFFHHLLFHFPEVAHRSFRPEFDRPVWRTDPRRSRRGRRDARGTPSWTRECASSRRCTGCTCRVALVAFETVVGKLPGEGAHETVARDLGDDRGSGDRQTERVAVDDRVGAAVQRRQPVAVHQGQPRRR